MSREITIVVVIWSIGNAFAEMQIPQQEVSFSFRISLLLADPSCFCISASGFLHNSGSVGAKFEVQIPCYFLIGSFCRFPFTVWKGDVEFI
ncbi:hypothetical protein AAHA92_02033 [Salvia divinorum]|uniref:Secreted protein n=1 Tax=Salvia divinorum TaxID=28513 RepID=A0ABD1IF97_SALDI